MRIVAIDATRRRTRVAVVALLCAAGSAACERWFPDPSDNRGVLDLTPAVATDTADGQRIVLLRAHLDTSGGAAASSVAFATSAGTLLPNGTAVVVPPDDSGFASAELRAPGDSAVALVTATAGEGTRVARVTFVPAPATRLQLSTDSLSVAPGARHPVLVTAALVRSAGTPSPGAVVRFIAHVAGSMNAVGQFSSDSVLAASTQASTRFIVPDTGFRGDVVLRATTARSGVTVADSVTIHVNRLP